MKEHLGWKVSAAILFAIGCFAMAVSRDLGTLILFLPFVALLSEKGQLRGKIDLRDWKPVLVWVVVIVLAVVVDCVVFKPS
ncbi:hypothetical protein [Roseibacillus persicicus]|nr:hypothetical protein [Roseibacillus persicicus]